MNFIVRDNYYFTENITIKNPNEKQLQQITVKFKLLEKDAIEKIKKENNQITEKLLQNAVIDIKGLIDENGKQIKCDQKLKKRLLNIAFIAKPIIEKYANIASGVVEKNLELPSDSKPTDTITLK